MNEWILKRRSIRQFTDEPLSEAQITSLMEAAMAAPTANNTQDWEFIIVTDRTVLSAFADALPYGKMCARAAAAIIVLGNPEHKYYQQHAAAATQNIMLSAVEWGLGSVWLGMMDEDRIAGIRSAADIPENRIPVTVIAVGYPAEEKPARTQYDPAKIHRDRYGNHG